MAMTKALREVRAPVESHLRTVALSGSSRPT